MQTKNQTMDVNEHITNRIISKLEEGIIPWKHPYTKGGFPQNLISGKQYRGINTWLLSMLNYPQNYFLSFKQVKDIGGSIKKDEKPHDIIYWNWTDVIDKQSNQSTKVPFLRLANVYNVAQCEGLSIEPVELVTETLEEAIKHCEAIIEIMPNKPQIKVQGKQALYNPFEDFIQMFPMKRFETIEGYYDLLFSLLTHSTGHPTRLHRKELLMMEPFIGDPFSIEEMIADIGSSYLKFYCGIPLGYIHTSDDRIEGWLRKLRADKRLMIYACSLAQKAAAYIMNVKFEETPIEETTAVEQTGEAVL